MTVKVNKEITNYKENFFNGLTRRATLTIVIIGICMVSGFLVNEIYVGGEYFQMFMMAVATITAFVGFYYKDGIWGGTYLFLLYRQIRLKQPLNCADRYSKVRARRLLDNKRGKPTIKRVEIPQELLEEAMRATSKDLGADNNETGQKAVSGV